MTVPPISAGTAAGRARPAASLYAVVKSSCAVAATGSPRCFAPVTIPGPNPDSAVPGLIPRSPETTEGPVLVTVELARTAKLPADPRATGAGDADHRQTEDAASNSRKPDFFIDLAFVKKAKVLTSRLYPLKPRLVGQLEVKYDSSGMVLYPFFDIRVVGSLS